MEHARVAKQKSHVWFLFYFILFRTCIARQEIKQFFKSTNFNINVFPKMTDTGKFVNSFFYFDRLYIFLKISYLKKNLRRIPLKVRAISAKINY